MRRLTLILIACAALAVPAAARADGYADTVRATSGLAAYWRLDEASGATATDALGGWNATWSGAPGLGAPGALSFDDDAGVTLNGSSAAWAGGAGNFPGDFSVEAWIKPTSSGTRYAVSRGSTTRGYGLWLTSTWAVAFSSGSTTARSAPVAQGVWHHVVGTVAGRTVTLYVDGAVAATATLPGAPLTTGSSLYLGRYSPSWSRLWKGGLDDVALYGAALSPADVAAHWAAGADLRPARVQISGGPPALTSDSSASFDLQADKAQVSFQCSLDGGAWSACSSSPAYSGLGDGSHSFSARAVDRYGVLTSDPETVSWQVDTHAPTTWAAAIQPRPADPVARLAFASSEPGSRFECSLDGGDWGPCASPMTLPVPADGQDHAFAVRAVDAAGNADPGPATIALTTDGPVPGGPGSPFTGAGAAFAWASSGGAAFECSLDGAPMSLCDGTAVFPRLDWGTHTFAVRAHFADGVVLDVPAAVWTAAAPTTQLAGLQLPVVVRRARGARRPIVRFSLNVAAPVRLAVERYGRSRSARSMGTWSLAGRQGGNVAAVPSRLYRRLRPGRYRLTAQAGGARPVRLSFVVLRG